jgi:hypothetical protein
MESDDFFVPTVVVRGRCVSVPRVVLRLSVRGRKQGEMRRGLRGKCEQEYPSIGRVRES